MFKMCEKIAPPSAHTQPEKYHAFGSRIDHWTKQIHIFMKEPYNNPDHVLVTLRI